MLQKNIDCYIRLAGLRRSGNHAVINWMISQYRGRICFRNDVQSFGKLHRTASNMILALREGSRLPVDLRDEGDKQLFLSSFEDKRLSAVFDAQLIPEYPAATGHTITRFFHIIVLRDPFNFFASRMRFQEKTGGTWRYPLTDPSRRQMLFRLWKNYARLLIRFSQHPAPHEIYVNYDSWLTQRVHRELICHRLGIPLSDDDSRFGVPRYGGASSFTGKRRPQAESDYLNRWQPYRQHPAMLALLEDKELLEISDEIFHETVPSATVLDWKE